MMKIPELMIRMSVMFAVAGSLSCISNSVNGGSGSTTETAIITGTICNIDGSFARNARITLRKRSSLAGTISIMSKKSSPPDTATTTTNNHGIFTVNSIDTGIYVVEGSDGSNNCSISDSVNITGNDATVTVATDTLKPAGAIMGTVQLPEGGDPQEVYVLAFGIDRFTRVEPDGSFRFKNLAEGSYDLRLISTLDNYMLFDTSNINVVSEDTTNIGTVSLPLKGLPSPENVAIVYDTLLQIATLTWSMPDTITTARFNVYRRCVDSNSVFRQTNSGLVCTSFFTDSSVVQDHTYEYMVAAVDTDAAEGRKSSAAEVTAAGAFTVADSVVLNDTANGRLTSVYDMTCDMRQNLHIVSFESGTGNSPVVRKFDDNDSCLLFFGTRGSGTQQFLMPTGIATDRRNRIYVTDSDNGRIQIFDSTGAFVQSIYGQVSDSSKLLHPDKIAVDDSAVYVGDFSTGDLFSTIKKFDLQGNFLKQWRTINDATCRLATVWAMKITAAGELAILDENAIHLFSKQGIFLYDIPTKCFGLVNDFDINGSSYYLSTFTGTVIILDGSGNVTGKYYSGKTMLSQIAVNGSVIFLACHEDGSIRILEMD